MCCVARCRARETFSYDRPVVRKWRRVVQKRALLPHHLAQLSHDTSAPVPWGGNQRPLTSLGRTWCDPTPRRSSGPPPPPPPRGPQSGPSPASSMASCRPHRKTSVLSDL